MTCSLRRNWSIGLLAVLTLLLLNVGVASAHASVKSSTPAAGSTVATAPARITVVFDNESALDGATSKLGVKDASGTVVDMGDVTLDKSDADRKTLTVSLKSGLPNGAYTVNWTAVSAADGSAEDGSFKFNIGTAPAAPAQLPTTGAGDVLALEAILVGAGGFLLVGLTLRRRLSR